MVFRLFFALFLLGVSLGFADPKEVLLPRDFAEELTKVKLFLAPKTRAVLNAKLKANEDPIRMLSDEFRLHAPEAAPDESLARWAVDPKKLWLVEEIMAQSEFPADRPKTEKVLTDLLLAGPDARKETLLISCLTRGLTRLQDPRLLGYIQKHSDKEAALDLLAFHRADEAWNLLLDQKTAKADLINRRVAKLGIPSPSVQDKILKQYDPLLFINTFPKNPIVKEAVRKRLEAGKMEIAFRDEFAAYVNQLPETEKQTIKNLVAEKLKTSADVFRHYRILCEGKPPLLTDTQIVEFAKARKDFTSNDIAELVSDCPASKVLSDFAYEKISREPDETSTYSLAWAAIKDKIRNPKLLELI